MYMYLPFNFRLIANMDATGIHSSVQLVCYVIRMLCCRSVKMRLMHTAAALYYV
jgi:hypothetical protein